MTRGLGWTDEDTLKLRTIYPDINYTIDEIMQEFPTRTQNAIRLKASRLGLERAYMLDVCPHCGESLRTPTDG